jgi:hypothetical protein
MVLPVRGPQTAAQYVLAAHDPVGRDPVALGPDSITLVEGATLKTRSLTTGKVLVDTPLPGVAWGVHTAPSQTRAAMAFPWAGHAFALLDTARHVVVARGVTANKPLFRFARQHESTWAVVPEVATEAVQVFVDGTAIASIALPRARFDIQFHDGVGFALAPDGTAAVVLGPDGTIRRVDLPTGAPVDVGVVSGARGLWWPTSGRVVAVGPEVVAFVDLATGAIQRFAGGVSAP